MTTTTHASTAAPKPVETANKPAQANARASADKPAEADLFASLLSLVSDTHLAPAAATPPDAETALAVDGAVPADDKKDENPLAALLAWAMPPASAPTTAAPTGSGATDTKATTASPTPTAALGIDKALAEAGVHIDGMTRVDEAAPAPTLAALARAAAASRPAFSPLHAGTLAPQRAGDATTASHSGAPAMVWQRGAVSGTEALQQQHVEQHAQVRSTVALNERFGFSGATEPGAPPLREFGSSTATSPGSAAALGAGLDTSQTVTGASGADSTGGDSTRDGQTEQALGDAQAFADGSAETEGPTVSHWGTQHLRHASLRVGGEGTEAIDIQLSVKGQEVQVAFQTDSAEARASLRESAGESLGDLLQRSGIQLGGVSVGGQGQAQGDGSQQPRTAGLSTEALGRTHAAAEPASRPGPQLRSDGSRPLDVFA
jgi:flagellar hook-length control protein FliK